MASTSDSVVAEWAREPLAWLAHWIQCGVVCEESILETRRIILHIIDGCALEMVRD